MTKKIITIMTPCYNEEPNVKICYETIRDLFAAKLPDYEFEHLFIDNCSRDRTVEILREIAREDKRVRVIVNSRNFGPHQSPYHAILQSSGDAVIPVTADLQTPPEMIPEFIRHWEEGYKMVLAVRVGMQESPLLQWARNTFYSVIARVSHIEQIRHFIGYGLFDKKVVDILRDIDDAQPYFRGLISEIGFEKKTIEYKQPPRLRGKSKHSFFDLIDMAALGIFSYSMAPLRLMTLSGVVVAAISLMISMIYLILKLVFWDEFPLGVAPTVLGILFFGAVQMLCFGVLGEYIGLVLTQVKKRPLVIERERINFDR